MGQLVEEVKIWNTPAVGAFLLWKFTCGYVNNHPAGDSPVGLLHFVASGILSNKELLDAISNRRENLASFVRWFEEQEKVDVLMEIQARIKTKLKYTLESLDVAMMSGLLVWEPQTAKIYPLLNVKTPKRGFGLNALYKSYGTKAEALGKWFAQHDLRTIATYLKIVF